MLEIKHVTQPDDRSCVAACLRMISFNCFHLHWFEEQMEADTSMQAELFALAECGIVAYVQPHNQFMRGEIHLVTVPSLNFRGKNHRIVVDFRRDDPVVFDPQKDRLGKDYYQTLDDLTGYSEITILKYNPRRYNLKEIYNASSI